MQLCHDIFHDPMLNDHKKDDIPTYNTRMFIRECLMSSSNIYMYARCTKNFFHYNAMIPNHSYCNVMIFKRFTIAHNNFRRTIQLINVFQDTHILYFLLRELFKVIIDTYHRILWISKYNLIRIYFNQNLKLICTILGWAFMCMLYILFIFCFISRVISFI